MTLDPQKRPIVVTVVSAITFTIGLAFAALGTLFLMNNLYGAAFMAGAAPATLFLSGAVGLYRGTERGRQFLVGALGVGAWLAALVTLLGIITGPGRSDISFWLTVGGAGLTVTLFGMLWTLRSTSLNSYVWSTQLSGMGRTPDEELLEQVALGVGDADSDESEVVAEKDEAVRSL